MQVNILLIGIISIHFYTKHSINSVTKLHIYSGQKYYVIQEKYIINSNSNWNSKMILQQSVHVHRYKLRFGNEK